VKVLLVDDEPLTLAGIARMLRAESCVSEVRTAEYGQAALQILENWRADIIITDIRMPEMDGLELIECIRRANLCDCFIIISSHADFQYARRGITLGVRNYLLNPIDRSELHLAIVDAARSVYLESSERTAHIEKTPSLPDDPLDENRCRLFVDEMIRTYRDETGPTARCLIHLTALVAQRPQLSHIVAARLNDEEFLLDGGYATERDGAAPPYPYKRSMAEARLYAEALRVLRHISADGALSCSAQRILSYLIANDCNAELSLKTLARATGLNPNYASGVVSKEFGIQFQKYVNLLRMIRAQELLRTPPNLPVQEVAIKCGFDNSNHFYRVFKAYTGVTPGEFKPQNNISRSNPFFRGNS
jgi:two-component system response regulator YesN